MLLLMNSTQCQCFNYKKISALGLLCHSKLSLVLGDVVCIYVWTTMLKYYHGYTHF